MHRVLISLLVLSALTAPGATRYVNVHSANPQSPYSTKGTAARSISQAVTAASAGDTILVATGRYVLATQVVLNKGVTLRASGNAADTIVDGNNSNRCFMVKHAAASLDGFMITQGKAASGGGVYQEAGTVINCLIISNTAIGDQPMGGGIYSEGLVKNCDILYNTAISTNTDDYAKTSQGGGIACSGGTIVDSYIAFNTGTGNYVDGGGAWVNGGSMTYCFVMNNSALGLWYAYGGGIYGNWGAEIERCWISGNVANALEVWLYTTATADGGGIRIGNGTTVRNSLIYENVARSAWGFPSGGGAWVSGSTLFHCTVRGNQAIGSNNPSKGGGIVWGYTCTSQGNIIWANTAGTGQQHFIGSVSDVDFDYTCSDLLPPGIGNQNSDPRFMPFSSQLSSNSPCIDAARPAITHTCDLDGYPRPQDGNRDGTAVADIGCYEAGGFVRPSPCDFDGDGRTDPAVMRAANGKVRLLYSQTWRVWNSSSGAVGWKAAPADYDGDGLIDAAWFDPATRKWHICESSSNGLERLPLPRFGAAADLPMPADFDGDGKADLAVRRAADGKLQAINSSDAMVWTSTPGKTAWIATPADYDGDGKADLAWYQPGSPGVWRIYQSGSGYSALAPAPTSPGGLYDIPIVGDFDGDGKTDRAVFSTATGKFRVKESQSSQAWASVAGNKDWKPAPGDYNGDGLTDCAWFNPATGRMVVLYSDTNNANNTLSNLQTLPAFGAGAQDKPLVYQKGK